jgi:hypothetical protein
MSVDTRPFHAPWHEREVVKSNVVYGQLINKLNNHDLQVSEGITIKNAVILFVLINSIYSELRTHTEFLLITG